MTEADRDHVEVRYQGETKMRMNRISTFRKMRSELLAEFKAHALPVPNNLWQGVDVSNKPEMMTHELEDVAFTVQLPTEQLEYYRTQLMPNLPWADMHFESERVSKQPINPGESWKQWPWGHSADKFRDEKGQYNHSYAERYWPKFAALTDGGIIEGTRYSSDAPPDVAVSGLCVRRGIRYAYGDLSDVVRLLVRNPDTRNAYLPVWFPEDTGVVHCGRTPCTLGYLFRMRRKEISIHYDIRSCDFKRHFLDDVYLTVRLLLWVLAECRKLDKRWEDIKPGDYKMHIGSLHVFANDFRTL